MATVKFNVATSMLTFAGYDFPTQEYNGGGGNTTDTNWTWDWSSGFRDIVTGTGLGSFGTSAEGFFPGTGTVTGWELDFTDRVYNPAHPFTPDVHTYVYWTFTDMSVPGHDFSDAIQGDGATLAAYMPTIFAGDDTIQGSTYNDVLLGYNGNDYLYGYSGNDTLNGGNGNDVLNGGPGNDTMRGGTGNDIFIVDSTLDIVNEYGSAGSDIVKSSVTYTLPNNVEKLLLTGSAPIDGTGNSLNNVMTGNSAENLLRGAGGNDTLIGGGGNDTLAGGIGNDTLTGGAGQDEFLFSSVLNGTSNVDHIQDFSIADDTIGLAQSAFAALTTPGTLASGAFYTGTSANDADDRIIYNSATGNIYYDDDGTGADAQILFAHVTAGLGLTNADFLVI